MTAPIITVEHLSKRYRLGEIGATTLRESAERWWHKLRGRDPAEHMGKVGQGKTADRGPQTADREESSEPSGTITADRSSSSHSLQSAVCSLQSNSLQSDELWALKDVSFEVKRGEVLGIIGRNGAGKSTLLKILSRITEPTSGRAILRGRVASLLEVGTGFHPELTGRENIYLNGAILGMKKREIDAKIDEIVAFSEVEQFIETPVKRYSSGMHVRLAFAVAAHLEPEILLVDEVLAVGDAQFKRKCMGKMHDVAGEGRTVLFVSHNMAAIQTLCPRAVLLSDGSIAMDGHVDHAVDAYLESIVALGNEDLMQRQDRKGAGRIRLKSIRVYNPENEAAGNLVAGRPARFEFEMTGLLPGFGFGYAIYDHHGQKVASFATRKKGLDDKADPRIGNRVICDIDTLLLRPGHYRINTRIEAQGQMQDHMEGAYLFDVEAGHDRGRPIDHMHDFGSVFFPHRWLLPC